MQTVRGPPQPLIEIAIEPRSMGDRQKLDLALSELAQRDHALRFAADPTSGQVILKGTDESQLEIIVDGIKHEFRVEIDVGPPRVAYRETITRPAEVDYIHRKQTGGSGEFARVKVRLEPLPPQSGFAFESAIGSALPEKYVGGVEEGLRAAAEDGIIAGFPMIDLKATVLDAAFHEVDSSTLTFEIASRAAFKDGATKAAPVLLEPIMRAEVVTPDDCLGDVINDLNHRRGLITGMASRGNARVIDAMVPLSNMFGYVQTLRSMSRGRAEHTIQFDRYETVPLDPPPDRFPPAIGMRG
jgi:elongation factor G